MAYTFTKQNPIKTFFQNDDTLRYFGLQFRTLLILIWSLQTCVLFLCDQTLAEQLCRGKRLFSINWNLKNIQFHKEKEMSNLVSGTCSKWQTFEKMREEITQPIFQSHTNVPSFGYFQKSIIWLFGGT